MEHALWAGLVFIGYLAALAAATTLSFNLPKGAPQNLAVHAIGLLLLPVALPVALIFAADSEHEGPVGWFRLGRPVCVAWERFDPLGLTQPAPK